MKMIESLPGVFSRVLDTKSMSKTLKGPGR